MTSTATCALQITVNGRAHAMRPGMLLSELVQELKLDPRQVAIERNRAIVPRSQYESTPLMTGDDIEIVGFIGGG